MTEADNHSERIETFEEPERDFKVLEVRKEATAKALAKHLLTTFRWVVLSVLILGFVAVFCDMYDQAHGHSVSLVKDSVVPLLTGVGGFGATLFGPLLGFVLGYYFAERNKKT
jgi:hypothetical protein